MFLWRTSFSADVMNDFTTDGYITTDDYITTDGGYIIMDGGGYITTRGYITTCAVILQQIAAFKR